MKLRLALCASLLALSAPVQAYVSYSFSGYSDEEDPRFPEFSFYAEDFLSPSGSADQVLSIDPSTWFYSQNISVLSVYFTSNPHIPSQKIDGFMVEQRYAFPGQTRWGLKFTRAQLGQAGVYSNGLGVLTVSHFEGDIPAFTFVESDAGPFPGSTNNPIVGLPQQPANPGAVPEPATWALMIAGFGLVGSGLRRRRSGELRGQQA